MIPLKILLSFFLFIPTLFSNDLKSEELPKLTKSIVLQIEDFAPRDISKDIYKITLRVKKPTEFIEILSGNKPKRFSFEIGNSKADYLKDTIKINETDPSVITFLIKSKLKVEAGLKNLAIYSGKTDENMVQEIAKQVEIPNRNSSPGKQPFIQSIQPEAGKRGDSITISGENFGNDLDNITLSISDSSEKDADATENLHETKPFYLSPIQNGNIQEIKFNMPSTSILPGFFLYKQTVFIRLFINGRPSDYKKIIILSEHWKIWMLGLTVSLLIGFHFFIVKILKKTNYIEMLLIDKTTNTYSLSRFQALVWTVLLLGGYFYIVLSTGVLLGNGIIPEFNPSLIGLLSISYGGLITSHSLGSKKPKNEIIKTPPLLSNLFSSGETIDLPRLQLFSFTVVGVIIYIYNLLNSNPLNGLPDIPSTFLGLLGVSQTGYITGKFVSDKIVINQVKPYYIPTKQGNIRVHILGAGFVPNMKILLEDTNEPINIDFINSNAISFILPSVSSPGMQKITILHNDFAPVVSDNCFETIKIEPQRVPSFDNSTITLTAGKIPPGTEFEVSKEEECFRVRGTILPGNKIEFRTPNLPPGKYDMSIYFKSGNDFEKVKYPDQLSVFTKDAVSNQTIIQENEIDSDEDSDLPDKTEMPWYRDGMTDEDMDTQIAIELGEEMEGELKISDIKEV